MTRTEHLLTILAEECCEVAQRATKALRFGLTEIQPGLEHPETNAACILGEHAHLLAAVEMLCEEGSLPPMPHLRDLVDAKKIQVEHFLKYSAEIGTLEPSK